MTLKPNGALVRNVFRSAAFLSAILCASGVAAAQVPATDAAAPVQQIQPQGNPPSASGTQTQAPTTQTPSGGKISGTVKAGAVPLPGVSVTATNTLTGKKYATATDVVGTFAMTIPRNGRYVVKAELAAFAGETKEVLINAAGENGGKPEQVADFTMQLASRVLQQEQQQQAQQGAAASALAGVAARGMQSLSVSGGAPDLADASTGTANSGAQMPSLAGLGSETAATDSVAVSGQMGQTNGLANFNEDDIRQRVEEAMTRARQQGGAAGDVANAVAGMLGGMMTMGGPGGGGPGGGGPGGFMVRGGGGGRGGRGGFNPTQPHGAIFYQGGNGALDATSFSLTGAPVVKPSYSSNRFGVSFTGSPFILRVCSKRTRSSSSFSTSPVSGIRIRRTSMAPCHQQQNEPGIFRSWGSRSTIRRRGSSFSATER